MTRSAALVLSLLGTALLSVAQPTLLHPISSQLPPIARPGTPFSFGLLPDTFSAASPLSYTVSGLPRWARFDPTSRTFFGTPSAASDVATSWVELEVRDRDGVARDAFSLVVLDEPAPVVKYSVSEQLKVAVASAYPLQYENGLTVPPGWSFAIGFEQYTFATPGQDRIFYDARLEDSTPLPEWLHFDNETVTFWGVAPWFGSGQSWESFDVVLSGSERRGYGGVSESFGLIVTNHHFDLVQPLQAINATAGSNISYTIDTSLLRLDFAAVAPSNLSSIELNISDFPWLSYDSKSRTITGVAPSDLARDEAQHYRLPVTFTTALNDVLRTTIPLAVYSPYFAQALLPDYTVPRGQKVVEILLSAYGRNMSTSPMFTLALDPPAAAQWLTLKVSPLALVGSVPDTFARTPINATITAVDGTTFTPSTLHVSIAFEGGARSNDSVKLSPERRARSRRQALIALAVVLPICIITALVALCICCVRQRRCERDTDPERAEQAPSTPVAREKKGSSILFGSVEGKGIPVSLDSSSSSADKLSPGAKNPNAAHQHSLFKGLPTQTVVLVPRSVSSIEDGASLHSFESGDTSDTLDHDLDGSATFQWESADEAKLGDAMDKGAMPVPAGIAIGESNDSLNSASTLAFDEQDEIHAVGGDSFDHASPSRHSIPAIDSDFSSFDAPLSSTPARHSSLSPSNIPQRRADFAKMRSPPRLPAFSSPIPDLPSMTRFNDENLSTTSTAAPPSPSPNPSPTTAVPRVAHLTEDHRNSARRIASQRASVIGADYVRQTLRYADWASASSSYSVAAPDAPLPPLPPPPHDLRPLPLPPTPTRGSLYAARTSTVAVRRG